MTALAGTGDLVRLALRLDRVRLAVWIVAISGTVIATAATLAEVYPTVASRRSLGEGIARNPALAAMLAPAFDLSSVGGMVAWRAAFAGSVLVPLMSVSTVIRHTRAEEESGRLDLVGAGVVGRYAPLAAAGAVAFGASLAVGALVAVGLIGQGEAAGGAVALGLAYASAGWMFAATAAVAAQFTQGARAATGLAAGVLGLSFVLRAVGDSAGRGGLEFLSWLSPIGWTQQVRPFAGERWWVFGLAAAFAAAAGGAALRLVARRDTGAGLLPPRVGPAAAPPGLRSPLALAWRLHRGTLGGWAVGFAVVGTLYGSVASGIGDFVNDSPQIRDIFERLGGRQRLVDAYLAATLGILGFLAAAYATSTTLRLRSEETGLRAEPVLAAGAGRARWAGSHLAVAAAGTAVLLAVAGLTEGLAHGLRTGEVGTQLPRLVGGALVQVPAAWVVAGVAMALFGAAPRHATAAWGVLTAFLVAGQLGPAFGLDQWVVNASPFTHVPMVPGDDVTLAPLLALTGVAGGLAAAGLVAFRRRDVG